MPVTALLPPPDRPRAMRDRPPGPYRDIESAVWSAALALDDAVRLAAAHATRPAPDQLAAHDLVAALGCVADSFAAALAEAAADVAGLGVMRGHGVEGEYRAGPWAEVASVLAADARLARIVADGTARASELAAVAAAVPPFPDHQRRPVLLLEPGGRVVLVVDGLDLEPLEVDEEGVGE